MLEIIFSKLSFCAAFCAQHFSQTKHLASEFWTVSWTDVSYQTLSDERSKVRRCKTLQTISTCWKFIILLQLDALFCSNFTSKNWEKKSNRTSSSLNYFCLNILDLFNFAANFVRKFFSFAFDYFQQFFCLYRFWDQQLCFESFIDFAILSRSCTFVPLAKIQILFIFVVTALNTWITICTALRICVFVVSFTYFFCFLNLAMLSLFFDAGLICYITISFETWAQFRILQYFRFIDFYCNFLKLSMFFFSGQPFNKFDDTSLLFLLLFFSN